jgi:glutamate receptor-interacting protein
VIGVPLSSATKLLQANNETIELRLSRNVNSNNSSMGVNNNLMINSMTEKNSQTQALYAEVQRRPMNLLHKPAEVISSSTSSSRSGSNNSDGQTLKTIHVTLFKDQVYDDYGFSVSGKFLLISPR